MKTGTGNGVPSETERVTLRAYEIWVAQGRPSGRATEHWVQAERELRAAAAAPVNTPSPSPQPAPSKGRKSQPTAAR